MKALLAMVCLAALACAGCDHLYGGADFTRIARDAAHPEPEMRAQAMRASE